MEVVKMAIFPEEAEPLFLTKGGGEEENTLRPLQPEKRIKNDRSSPLGWRGERENSLPEPGGECSFFFFPSLFVKSWREGALDSFFHCKEEFSIGGGEKRRATHLFLRKGGRVLLGGNESESLST